MEGMTVAPTRARLVVLSAAEFGARLDAAINIYLSAMGYPAASAAHRSPLWLQHCRRAGWRAVGAVDGAGALVGIAYGYIGAPGQWWHDEVARGMRRSGVTQSPWLTDYFELTELHVRPDSQGAGIGEALLRDLLAGTDRPRVLLSTPEKAADRAGRAWRLYRRTGFQDVLRRYCFSGDPRPFAVLGRSLPLPDLPGGSRRATGRS
jgi:ribosomal protein S18 acetylase RimI-like enzyme